MKAEKQYIAIDLKSFYASVECVERGLDPLTTNLVVTDVSRTEKTICLAVSPSLKAYGIPGRPRLFEVVQAVKEINSARKDALHGHPFQGSSAQSPELAANPGLSLDYIAAPPRMATYMKYSTEIYRIYLKYISPEDIHVYSCDEVFMDVTHYLSVYSMNAHELAMTMIRDVYKSTGITATAGIGTNLYLCKIAMDIVAKHIPADADGVRIAGLDEQSYREKLWDHTPLSDFWRVGAGTQRRLARMGLYTMGDIARYSEQYEDALYQCFGVNAELLIDHAWGWEPCTIEAIKKYRPENNSIGSGQVLQRPYHYEEAAIVVREMADLLSLDLVEKGLVSKQLVLTISYDSESLNDPLVRQKYKGEVHMDHYGRAVPKHAHGTANLDRHSASTRLMTEACMDLYKRIVDPDLLVRRINLTACNVVSEEEGLALDHSAKEYRQLDLFTDFSAEENAEKEKEERLAREKSLQLASIAIKKKFGKNAILKGSDLLDGATTIERNRQIGGHKA